MTDEVAARWGELNKKLVDRGWVAPYGHRKRDVPVRADGLRQLREFHPVYFNDYSSFCLK